MTNNSSRATAEEPVLDANGDPVALPDDVTPNAALRRFMAGRVPAPACPHYIAKVEAAAGLDRCEHCTLDVVQR